MVLAVLVALVSPQKHSAMIVSSDPPQFKRVCLHYIAVSDCADCKHETCCGQKIENT